MFADGDAARPWHRFSHDFALPLPVGDAELPHLCRGIAAIKLPLGMMCSPSFFINIIFINVSVFAIIDIIAIVLVVIVSIAINSISLIIEIVI